ncbi:MAG: ParB/RepB/Spo0J family partition protein [Bacillota bacterium]
MSKNRLGRGLDALLSDSNSKSDSDHSIKEIYVENIEPNPFQPRQEFDQESLEELAQSIKNNGVLQPITVREAKPELYQLVTGERRWRACKLIGLKKVPAIIKEYSDDQMMEIALIENLQREDLNPIEEAQAYKKMMDNFDMTQEDVSKKVGKSRSSIANMVRLLNLTPKVQMFVSRGTLSMGHARALLALKDNKVQIKAAEHVIKNNLSVRETEKYVSRLNNLKKANKSSDQNEKPNKLNEKWLKARKKIASYFETEVKVRNRKNKKILSIECKDDSDLERIMEKLNI